MSSNDLLNNLASQKPQFVEKTRSRVYSYIVRQERKTCVSIVEKDAYGFNKHRTHRPGIDSYLAVLGCFCTKQDYHGHELDSALSEPVIEIISSCYSGLLDENSEQVQEYFRQKIVGNKVVLEEAMKIVMEKLSAKGLKVTQAKMAELIHDATSQVVHHAAHTKLGMAVGHGVAVAAGSTAGAFLAKMLMEAVAHHINYILAHLMSNVMAKAAIKAIAKKLCLVAITSVIVKMLATKFGITTAASTLHVIGWVFIGGYLTVKLIGLPEEMAEKVSNGVRDTLNDNYTPCLRQIIDNLTKSALDPEKLAATMVDEMTDLSGWQKELEKGVNFSDPNLPRLEKDVKKDAGRIWGLMLKFR